MKTTMKPSQLTRSKLMQQWSVVTTPVASCYYKQVEQTTATEQHHYAVEESLTCEGCTVRASQNAKKEAQVWGETKCFTLSLSHLFAAKLPVERRVMAMMTRSCLSFVVCLRSCVCDFVYNNARQDTESVSSPLNQFIIRDTHPFF